MSLTSHDVFSYLFRYLDSLPCAGTLQSMQRAVLSKGAHSLDVVGHWPIIDFPLALMRAFKGADEQALPVAAACALFYAFADITDDAQDHDLKGELWEQWGWEQAVNTGSSLLFLSLRLLQDELPKQVSPSLVQTFVDAGFNMTRGQHADLLGHHSFSLSIGDYLRTAEGKSGASFGAYASVAAQVGSLEEPLVLSVQELGTAMGVYFQMINDTYELWSGRLSPDFVNCRLSLPVVLGLEQLTGKCRARFLELIEGSKTLENQMELSELLTSGGIRAYLLLRVEVLRNRIRTLAEKVELSDEPYLNQLLSMPTFPEENVMI